MNTYEAFYRTFLAEMPWRVGGGNDFEAQLEALRENINEGGEVERVTDVVYKVVSDTTRTYWIGDETATDVSVIVDAEVNGNFCKVTLTSKNPSIPAKSPPYASELYLIIKNDLANLSLVFSSDYIMSDDAINLWKGIVNRGNKVSVYNTASHQYVLDRVETASDLEKFVGDLSHQRFVFVLSENAEGQRGVRHSFSIMEIKRRVLYPLFEDFKKNSSIE